MYILYHHDGKFDQNIQCISVCDSFFWLDSALEKTRIAFFKLFSYRRQVDESLERNRQKEPSMLPGNDRRRWHGTVSECAVGDNPKHPGRGLCWSRTCYLCIIIRRSF